MTSSSGRYRTRFNQGSAPSSRRRRRSSAPQLMGSSPYHLSSTKQKPPSEWMGVVCVRTLILKCCDPRGRFFCLGGSFLDRKGGRLFCERETDFLRRELFFSADMIIAQNSPLSEFLPSLNYLSIFSTFTKVRTTLPCWGSDKS